MEINLDQDHNDPRSKYHSVIQDREKYQKKKLRNWRNTSKTGQEMLTGEKVTACRKQTNKHKSVVMCN